jgi:hypothetical protein
MAVIKRHQRGNLRARKPRIGLIDNFGKSLGLYIGTQKRHQNGFGNVLKTGTAKALQRLSRQLRPVVGHIKAAVTGQTCKQGRFE